MLDLLGEGPSRAARRALLRGDDANGLAGYYEGDDAAYESELARRRALRKSLRDEDAAAAGERRCSRRRRAPIETATGRARAENHDAEQKQRSLPINAIGADGVAFELASLREAEDGDGVPVADGGVPRVPRR